MTDLLVTALVMCSVIIFFFFQDETKQLLLVSLPVLAQHIPVNKLKTFLFTLILPKVASGSSWLTLHTLRGLLGALMLKEPPQSVMPVLHEFTKKLCKSLSVENMVSLYEINVRLLLGTSGCIKSVNLTQWHAAL